MIQVGEAQRGSKCQSCGQVGPRVYQIEIRKPGAKETRIIELCEQCARLIPSTIKSVKTGYEAMAHEYHKRDAAPRHA
jgi:coenzyme F420-reducing hydrogenase beta subunit